ncbi:MAG: hypothetical protein ACXWMS_03070 [Syntrophales bacterium]
MDRNVTGIKEKEIRELHNRIVVLEKLVSTLNEKVEKLEELIKIEDKFKDWKA